MERGIRAGAELNRLLEEHGWTQDDLAARTSIGRGTINGYATGRLRLGGKNAPRIAQAFGLPDDYFTTLGRPDDLAALQRRAEELETQARQLREALRHLQERASTSPGTAQSRP